MTTVMLQIPEDIEEKLLARAHGQGQDIAAVALDLLKKSLEEPAKERGPEELSYEEWNQRFEAWLNSHARIDVVVDDSRETIYEGR